MSLLVQLRVRGLGMTRACGSLAGDAAVQDVAAHLLGSAGPALASVISWVSALNRQFTDRLSDRQGPPHLLVCALRHRVGLACAGEGRGVLRAHY